MGALCGALGFWVVTERLSYGAESLSHGLLPGLVLAALADAPLVAGAAGGAVVAAALIAFAARDARIGSDTGTAVAVTGLVGLGALLALAPESPQRLEELLFGDPLGVTDGDLASRRCCSCAGGAALAVLHRPPVGARLRPVGRRRRRASAPASSGSPCWCCSPPRSRSASRASARCSCSRC